MHLWAAIATILAMATSGQTFAAEPAATGASLSRLCGLQKAGPYRFGVPRYEARLGESKPGRESFPAPFSRVNLVTTNWSGRVMLVEFRGPIAESDAGSAAETMMVAGFQRDGWRPLFDAADESVPTAPEIADADHIFTRTTDEKGLSGTLYAGLSWRAGQLTLACGRADLLALDRLEAEGVLPEDARRPQEPAPVTAAPLTSARCIDLETQAQAAAMFDGGTDAYVDQVGDQQDYWDRLARWQRWRLEKSGKVDAARLDELQYAAEDARNAAAQEDPLAAMTGALEAMPELEEARKSREPRRICEAYARVANFVANDLWQRAERSKSVSAAWAAEAARLDIPLD